MPVIRLCFLWHMHQPFYKDLVSGQYRLPWVRMHALKDYYGMVKLLNEAEFPGVHQTFNLVPSLITQIQDYVDGTARDPFYDVIAKPASDLTPQERQFALQYLFQANETHLIGRYPRYAQLLEEMQSGNGARWSDANFTDLQVLSQLAWFDEYWLDDPEVAELVRKGRAFGEKDQQLMLHKQRLALAAVLPAYRDAAARGTIEISTTPFYHPILPLLCDTNIGRVSAPEITLPHSRFRRPEDASEQITRALDFMQQNFGIRPAGVWPSEGSVSNEVLALAAHLGVEWMASDEGVLGRSLNSYFERDSGGKLSPQSASDLYRVYKYEVEESEQEISLVFRDHSLSDLIGFVYAGTDAQTAAAHFIQQIRSSAAPVLASGRDAVVSVILDGENAWEHFPQSGREFLRRLYAAIEADPEIEAQTIGAAVAQTKSSEAGLLHNITPGSWINANFNVWIGAPEDNRSWDLLSAARNFYERNAAAASEAQRQLAYEELLICEGSDWNWWYGPEHHTANDSDFDDLYRQHLSNVYRALGAEPPNELRVPIIPGRAIETKTTPQTQLIRPRMRGEGVSYFDWMGAASCHASAQGAMHSGNRLLSVLYAGFDERFLYARLDFTHSSVPEQGECIFEIESGPALARMHVLIADRSIKRWWLSRSSQNKNEQPLGPAEFAQGLARLTHVLEVRVPQAAITITPGHPVNLRATWLTDGIPLDSLPATGHGLPLHVFSEEQLQELGQKHW